jgi:hypothetical protein
MSPITSEKACLLAIEKLQEKQKYTAAAILSLEKELRRLRSYEQAVSFEEYKRMLALPLSSRKLPIRPSPAIPVAG